MIDQIPNTVADGLCKRLQTALCPNTEPESDDGLAPGVWENWRRVGEREGWEREGEERGV